MRIISAEEKTVSLSSNKKNAKISFNEMTASAVIIEIQTNRGQFKGLGFSSYGRYGHGGLLRERFLPRLKNIKNIPTDGTCTEIIANIWDNLMTDEKEGGHGERSGAVGVLETALWDALAKSEGLPLWALLKRDTEFIETKDAPSGQTPIYASGGLYNPENTGTNELVAEVKQNIDTGYAWSKIKIGGIDPNKDMTRIEAAINAAGGSELIAVDANCAFGQNKEKPFLREIDQLGLRWLEEPVDPLDYQGLKICIDAMNTPIATGENIFSRADTRNLLQYGTLRANFDILQMDIVLSYGITEYIRMIKLIEALGWSRRSIIPHAGHQVALQTAAGLGLGGHEVASGKTGPFCGVSTDTRVENGLAILGSSPGVGIENKPELYKFFQSIF